MLSGVNEACAFAVLKTSLIDSAMDFNTQNFKGDIFEKDLNFQIFP